MASDGTIEITWYGHAMFTVSGGGVVVAVDPVPPEVGYTYEPVEADVLLITHGHYDHNHTAGIKGRPEVISSSGSAAAAGLSFSGYDSFHDDSKGKKRGPMVLFTWEQAGLKLAHLGDLGDRPAPEVIKSLEGLDVLMMPVGGVYTIDGEDAARLAADLAPAIVLPMHFGTPDCTIDLDAVDAFTQRFKGTVREMGDRPVVISRDSLPTSTEAWVLPYK